MTTIDISYTMRCLPIIISTLMQLVICSPSDSSKLSNNSSKELDSNIYACEWSYFHLDSSFVAFSINHLALADNVEACPQSGQVEPSFVEGYGSIQACEFSLRELSANATLEELLAEGLNPKLPFIFYINGFNTFNKRGQVNGTWMFDVAKMFARRGLQNRRNGIQPELGANIIFLTWGIPDIVADGALKIVPAYFKTIANYNQILAFVSRTITRLIRFVDESRLDESERRQLFGSYQFFGHSLGSHIIVDAIERALELERPNFTFGKLTGLDPALPCFLSLGRDRANKSGSPQRSTNSSVQQVVVMHSNAGLAGLTAEQANIEIVLNGGTFQPGCSWFDFVCHHQRATAIFGYMDDRCQMVAYKCSSYNHFKSGACETCEFVQRGARSHWHQTDAAGPNCVLVNMPEQHVDTSSTIEFVLARLAGKQSRQLIGEGQAVELSSMIERSARLMSSQISSLSASLLHSRLAERLNSATTADGEESDMRREKASKAHSYYHFVNTSPNFRSGRKTHCLQHYQLRAMILQDDLRAKQKCPISAFLSSGLIELRLFHNQTDQQSGGVGWRSWLRARNSSPTLKWSPTIKLDKIIKDSLYTSLLNFEGSPELFVGAELNNLQVDKLDKCLLINNSTDSPNVVLDIAFMSHTDYRFRKAFSSILCGRFVKQNNTNETTGESDTNVISSKLLLRLCKQSELVNVTRQIDNVLDHIQQQRLNDSWQVSLLNSLFSLFAEWEPF